METIKDPADPWRRLAAREALVSPGPGAVPPLPREMPDGSSPVDRFPTKLLPHATGRGLAEDGTAVRRLDAAARGDAPLPEPGERLPEERPPARRVDGGRPDAGREDTTAYTAPELALRPGATSPFTRGPRTAVRGRGVVALTPLARSGGCRERGRTASERTARTGTPAAWPTRRRARSPPARRSPSGRSPPGRCSGCPALGPPASARSPPARRSRCPPPGPLAPLTVRPARCSGHRPWGRRPPPGPPARTAILSARPAPVPDCCRGMKSPLARVGALR